MDQPSPLLLHQLALHDRCASSSLTQLRTGRMAISTYFCCFNILSSPFCRKCSTAMETCAHILGQCPTIRSALHMTLRTGHMAISAYFCHFNILGSLFCCKCSTAMETRAHILGQCPAPRLGALAPRLAWLRIFQRSFPDYRQMLIDPTLQRKLLIYVK